MSDFDDRYDPNSMDNYMDDLYYDEHYGSSGGSGFSSGSFSGRKYSGGNYSGVGPYALLRIFLLLLAIPVFIVGMILLAALPPLGVLVMLVGYKLIEG